MGRFGFKNIDTFKGGFEFWDKSNMIQTKR